MLKYTRLCIYVYIHITGPTAHNTRLEKTDLEDEHDVVLVFKLPSYERIKLIDNQDDYVMLDTSNIPTKTIMEDNSNNINRFNLQQWLKSVFKCAFKSQSPPLKGLRDHYNLNYELNTMRHTIYASSIYGNNNFSIDFVPGIRVMYEGNSVDWHAIPKLMRGRGAKYSFMISNSKKESDLLNDTDLKKALILMQALCAAKGLEKIKYYHLMNLVLAKNIHEYAKTETLQDIFIEVCSLTYRLMSHHISPALSLSFVFQILRNLYNAILDKHIPYVWEFAINLIRHLSPKELSDYEKILGSAYDTLSTYWHQDELSYETCNDHFEY